ncbi:MAG: UDP-glucose 4-epimerase GalE [Anaerolineales bacterium]|nr:UDP-glucose 4-epimerase GalE [Anaerolineales bacterium]
MEILVTGGTGYIGSHTVVELLQAGYQTVIVDNLSNSKIQVLERIEEITGKTPRFYKADLRDEVEMRRIFASHSFESVLHFAGLKAVGESVEFPLRYYHNNLTGTLILLQTMQEFGVHRFVFSSSCTVYGANQEMPLREDFPIAPLSPYGHTKAMIEQMLRDLVVAEPHWQVTLLRYFNPVGAHPSGLIGEDPNGIPNNLFPYITQVAVGRLPYLRVFGNDYPTPDGTGVRDYIHVVDLAIGHLRALEKLTQPGLYVYNLGTGRGYSVLEVVQAFEKATGKTIPYQIVDRRPGDVPIAYADPSLAQQELGWHAERGIEEMCIDAWRWQTKNPMGYEG